MEEQVDLKELARRLSTVFPNLVTMSDGLSPITVMGRVKVTSNGVEGAGPVAEKAKAIYEEYVREQSRSRQATDSASSDKAKSTRNPFRCEHCGLRLTTGRVYRRRIVGSVLLFCCKQCADHHETESVKVGMK